MKPQKANKTKRAPVVPDNVGFSMTPMIDIVFQLIIFFMLITDMTQKELEALEPPIAKLPQEQGENVPKRLIVNVTEEGEFKLGGDRYTLTALHRRVKEHGDRFRPRRDGISEASVMIRADGRAAYEHVQKVLQICGDPMVRISQIEIGARRPEAR